MKDRYFHTQGFSLVELMVVIAIIAILAGVLIASFAGGTETARAAKCMANLRNLAAAWNGGRAGSQEHMKSQMDANFKMNIVYTEMKGWISSDTIGLYPKNGTSDSHQKFDPIGFLEKDPDRAKYAYTNGWMHAAVGSDTTLFVCPTHVAKLKGKAPLRWSYFMNAYFGWDSTQGKSPHVSGGAVGKPNQVMAERQLLFAEIPFQGPGSWFPGDGSTMASDAILQYNGCNKGPTVASKSAVNGTENIGANHQSGKLWFAHVAFVDGHVEKLRADGLNAQALRDLTTYLCTGVSIGRNGNKYEPLD